MLPGVAYYLSRWYRKSEFAFRFALFIVTAPLAGAFGGLLAYGWCFSCLVLHDGMEGGGVQTLPTQKKKKWEKGLQKLLPSAVSCFPVSWR